MVQLKSNISPLQEEIKRLKFENSQLREKIAPSSKLFPDFIPDQQSTLVEQLQVGIIFTDTNGEILKCNRKVEEILGIKKHIIVGQFIHKIYSKLNSNREMLPGAIYEFLKYAEKPSAHFTVHVEHECRIQYINVNVSKIHNSGQNQFCFLLTDVTDEHNQFESIHKKFEESSTQLKEIHHRVKNNLQLISSFLNLEYSRHKSDSELSIESILKESQNKIYSISLIHKNLYENDELSTIEIGKYIRQLFCYITRLYNTENKIIHLELIDEIKHLPLKESISVGLLIDEIITNSFKHAFVGRDNGTIKIALTKEANDVNLLIADNGKGSLNHKVFESKNTFGMELIFTLVKQLRGSIDINSEAGIEYNILFPI